jgi:hypothetical protein
MKVIFTRPGVDAGWLSEIVAKARSEEAAPDG